MYTSGIVQFKALVGMDYEDGKGWREELNFFVTGYGNNEEQWEASIYEAALKYIDVQMEESPFEYDLLDLDLTDGVISYG